MLSSSPLLPFRPMVVADKLTLSSQLLGNELPSSLPCLRVAVKIVHGSMPNQLVIKPEQDGYDSAMRTIQFEDVVGRDFPGGQVASAALRTELDLRWVHRKFSLRFR